MNATTQAIIARLENKPVLSPGDIAAACVCGKFYISREEAVRYIESTAYTADEA